MAGADPVHLYPVTESVGPYRPFSTHARHMGPVGPDVKAKTGKGRSCNVSTAHLQLEKQTPVLRGAAWPQQVTVVSLTWGLSGEYSGEGHCSTSMEGHTVPSSGGRTGACVHGWVGG